MRLKFVIIRVRINLENFDMKRIFIAGLTLFFVLKFYIPLVDTGPYSLQIDRAIERLLEPDYRNRQLAAEELARLDNAADADLLAAFDKASISAKIALIEVYALRKFEGACQKIVDTIEFLPESATSRVAIALGQLGDKGWKLLVKKIANNNMLGSYRSPKLEKVYRLLVREFIINFFKAQLAKRKYTYFIEQYRSLFKYGSVAAEVVGEILMNDNNILSNITLDKTNEIQEAAARALGDSDLNKAAIKILKKALPKFPTYDRYDPWSRRYYDPYVMNIRTRIILALYNLGKTVEGDKLLKGLKDRINSNAEIKVKIAKMGTLAEMLLQIHKLDDAEKIYLNRIEIIRQHGIGKDLLNWYFHSHYNLASIYGRKALKEKDKGKKASYRRKTMQYLKQAVRIGYRDIEWVFIDMDVSIVWKTGEFKKWIDKLKKDPLLKDKIPDWEPGNPPPPGEEKKKKKKDKKEPKNTILPD